MYIYIIQAETFTQSGMVGGTVAANGTGMSKSAEEVSAYNGRTAY